MKTAQEIHDKLAELKDTWEDLKKYTESSDIAKGTVGGKLAALEWVLELVDREEI
jgi:CHASE3 domain sensor protein